MESRVRDCPIARTATLFPLPGLWNAERSGLARFQGDFLAKNYALTLVHFNHMAARFDDE